jgi:hypothetical protein
MLNFNLCYHKDCRKKVEYLAKDGMGYCSKHSVMIVNFYGIEEFWPHYHSAIWNDISEEIKREEKERKDKLADEALRNLDKDRKYHKLTRKK